MVAIKIVQPYLRSGSPFAIQVMRASGGDVTITFNIADTARDFGVNASPVQGSFTAWIAGGAPKTFTVEGWGSAAVGSIVTLFVKTPEGETDFDSATVSM